MKFDEMPEDVKERAKKLRKRLCELPVTHGGVLEDMCMVCVSPCGPGRELLDLMGLPKPPEPPHMADIFEPVMHNRGRRANKIVRAINKQR